MTIPFVGKPTKNNLKRYGKAMKRLKTQKTWEEEFDKEFSLVYLVNGSDASGVNSDTEELQQKLKSFISSTPKAQKEENDREWKEKIELIKKRFRCAACDGAKCEHTQGCQALKELLK